MNAVSSINGQQCARIRGAIAHSGSDSGSAKPAGGEFRSMHSNVALTVDGLAQRRCERRYYYYCGLVAEGVAAASLMLRGYRILDRRWRSPLGEIDLIAVRGRRLAFVEVKHRPDIVTAQDSITLRQRQRIRRASEQWLQKHASYGRFDLAFDVVYVTSVGGRRRSTPSPVAGRNGWQQVMSAASAVFALIGDCLSLRPHYHKDAFPFASR